LANASKRRIGGLGDAIVYSLQLRQRQNAVFVALLGDLGAARTKASSAD